MAPKIQSSSRKTNVSGKTTNNPSPTVSKFLRVVLQVQSDTRMVHWGTKSFATHKATDELFGKITKHADEFVERAVGRSGNFSVGRGFDIKVRELSKPSFVKSLKEAASFLEKDLPSSMNSKASDLLTIRDDLLGSIRKTLYLLSLS